LRKEMNYEKETNIKKTLDKIKTMIYNKEE